MQELDAAGNRQSLLRGRLKGFGRQESEQRPAATTP